MQPLISIVIPVYNCGHLIDNCIKSILSQTYKNIEIILVDDKSPDNITIGVLREWTNKDCHIRLLEKAVNGGSPRLDGVKISRGEYICFSDQDDWMPKDAIEKMYNASIHNDADVVIGQVSKAIKIGPFVKSFAPDTLCPHTGETILHEDLMGEYYESYFGHNIIPVSVWGKLYKRSLFDKAVFPDPWPRVSAGDLILSLALHPYIGKLSIISDVVYNYFVGMPGASPKYLDNWLPDACRLFEYKWSVIDDNNITQAIKFQAYEMINYIRTYVHLCTIYDYKNRDKRMKVMRDILKQPIWSRVSVIANHQSQSALLAQYILKSDYITLFETIEKKDTEAPIIQKVKYSCLRICASFKMFA